MTVSKWLDYWLTSILPHRSVKPGTVTSYRNTTRLYLKPYIGAQLNTYEVITRLRPE